MFYKHLISSSLWILFSLSCEGRPGEASLYSDLDKINLLNKTNIKNQILDSETAWLVEFYSSWCGHCINFAPTFKLLAADVYAWRDVISVGAIDCADDANTETCREYDIMGYPTMKFFPRKSPKNYLGERVDVRSLTVEAIRNEMTSYLLREQTNNSIVTKNWPKLLPSTLNKLSDLSGISNKPNQVVIVEGLESKIGVEVMLDLSLPLKRLEIPLDILRTTYNPNAEYANLIKKQPAVLYLGGQSNDLSVIQIKDRSRQGIYNSIKDFLWTQSSNFVMNEDKDPLESKIEIINQKQVKDRVNDNSSKSKKGLINRRYTVFLSDLEKTAVYALSHEIAQHQTIAGEAFEALRKFVTVLKKYFPSRPEFANVLKDIDYWVHQHEDAIHGEDLGSTMKSSLSRHGVEVSDKWIGCQGSKPHFGGYPCGLWSLWHALTVQHSIMNDGLKDDVLNAMKEYIEEYFGCRECAHHFAQTIQNGEGIKENVQSTRDSVLYLWYIHNKVNMRLSGDISEDPQYPKLVFPDKEFCFKCHIPTTGSNLWDEFNRDEVYKFLVNHYSSKINKQGIKSGKPQNSQDKLSPVLNDFDDVEESLDLSNFKKQDKGKLTVNLIFFNGADLSLYMFLWFISASIIILLYLKFVSKRWFKSGFLIGTNRNTQYNSLIGKV